MVHPRCVQMVMAGLALLAGCQKGAILDQAFTVESLSVKQFSVDAPRKQQRVTVTIKSPGVPLSAYLVLDKDRDQLVQRLERQQGVGGSILASRQEQEDILLEATIPEGSAYAVVLSNATNSDASAAIRITGQ